VSPGDEDEAVDYAALRTAGWRNTPGAIAWLRERMGAAPKKAAARKPAPPRSRGGERVH